jgi:hypothetical protein
MTIHELTGSTSPELARALAGFEALFSCSLGGGRTYRMTYPAGYLHYLESLGESRCFAAEKNGQIIGMIGGAVMRLRLPSGSEQAVVFVEEVKLMPAVQRTGALWPLLDQFQPWALARSDLVISVVLDETPIKPSAYTGRAGIVPFREVSRLMVLRVPAGADGLKPGDDRFVAPEAVGAECHRQLTTGRYAVLSDGAEQRSVMPPVWLVHPRGTACGRLEDRRKVRHVTMDDGSELQPLFLGSFAFRDADAGMELVLLALRHCARLGYTALRMAVAMEDFQGLVRISGRRQDILAITASVYATGVTTDAPWNLSGLEI